MNETMNKLLLKLCEISNPITDFADVGGVNVDELSPLYELSNGLVAFEGSLVVYPLTGGFQLSTINLGEWKKMYCSTVQ